MRLIFRRNVDDEDRVEIWTEPFEDLDHGNFIAIVHQDDLFPGRRFEPWKREEQKLKDHLTQFGTLECRLINIVYELPNN